MGNQISFKREGGSSLGYEALPPNGKGPAVIVLQEYWGLVPHIKQVCDRMAAQGFVALAPDLYHGETVTSPDDAGRLMMALNIEETFQELSGAVKYLTGHPKVSSSKIGIVGFCMGGQLALYAASKLSQIGACVDFYGIHPKVSIEAARIHCPVLGFFGETDSFVTPESAHKLESDLKAGGVKTDFSIFPAVGHAFFNDSRPTAYNKEAAKTAGDKMITFFKKNLS